MNNIITLQQKATINGIIRNMPASKSISNRALLINALAGGSAHLQNLSNANDTRLMRELLSSSANELNVEDAGTTMRFITAYAALTGKQVTITGTDRMKQRPLGLLVDALRKLGASIHYIEKDGFPPVRISGPFKQATNAISIRGDVSSQYISALMMVGPLIKGGLTINLEGNVTSKPYIEMTGALMKQFGAKVSIEDQAVHIDEQPYRSATINVEKDWSAASYWYAFTALAKDANIQLPEMTLRSIQGDRVIVDLMEMLGVKTEPRGNTLQLMKVDHHETISWDFKSCPDLAQTAAVVCAAKGIKATFTGLESLRIKETDRIKALQNELSKIGAVLKEENGTWTLLPGAVKKGTTLHFETYLDHRMAMAFAPLATLTTISLGDPSVVRKSYPTFWDDVASLGFITTIS